ncbi:MAG: twin-arginine translocation signal domain-containing protein, partial [Mailhella sp.]|nr:twin-arginine translocation signal domain-containing protein [Mailhella sp.]
MNRREFLTGSMATAGGALVGAGCANVPPAAPPKSAKIPYRMFWNWDHSTNWCENVLGVQNVGVANPYTKVGDFFEQDFRRMVDWGAAHGMQAIGIVGLLRDWHGGVEAARRLCGYARDKGVRIYIIAGLYAYGGAYYEGDSKYNLDAFFRANPDCIARKKDGSPFYARFKGHGGPKVEAQGCPSNPKLNAYVLESYDWLFKTIPELGGIQMEAGDNGVC